MKTWQRGYHSGLAGPDDKVVSRSGKGIGRIFLIVLGITIVVAAASGTLYWYASTPGFCSTCHIMKTRYVSWQRSPHGDNATCIECHSEPGVLGGLEAHVGGLRYVYARITGTRTGPVIRAAVSNDSCLRCHRDKPLGAVIGGHDPNHDRHITLNVNCAACHDNLVHGTLLGRPSRNVMATCRDCHREPDPALDSCKSCHTQQELLLRSLMP